jgi:hypothetical protein
MVLPSTTPLMVLQRAIDPRAALRALDALWGGDHTPSAHWLCSRASWAVKGQEAGAG